MKNAEKRVFSCKDRRRYSRKRAKNCRNFAKNWPPELHELPTAASSVAEHRLAFGPVQEVSGPGPLRAIRGIRELMKCVGVSRMAMFSENENEYGELQNLLPNSGKIENSLKFPKPNKLFIIQFICSTHSLSTPRAAHPRRWPRRRGEGSRDLPCVQAQPIELANYPFGKL